MKVVRHHFAVNARLYTRMVKHVLLCFIRLARTRVKVEMATPVLLIFCLLPSVFQICHLRNIYTQKRHVVHYSPWNEHKVGNSFRLHGTNFRSESKHTKREAISIVTASPQVGGKYRKMLPTILATENSLLFQRLLCWKIFLFQQAENRSHWGWMWKRSDCVFSLRWIGLVCRLSACSGHWPAFPGPQISKLFLRHRIGFQSFAELSRPRAVFWPTQVFERNLRGSCFVDDIVGGFKWAKAVVGGPQNDNCVTRRKNVAGIFPPPDPSFVQAQYSDYPFFRFQQKKLRTSQRSTGCIKGTLNI